MPVLFILPTLWSAVRRDLLIHRQFVMFIKLLWFWNNINGYQN